MVVGLLDYFFFFASFLLKLQCALGSQFIQDEPCYFDTRCQCSNNDLESITISCYDNSIFPNLSSILNYRSIEISYSGFQEIPARAFPANLSSLTELKLEKNEQLSYISNDALKGLKGQIETLTLGGCNFSQVPSTVGELPNLKSLTMDLNPWENEAFYPGMFANNSQLEEIFIEGNTLTTLPNQVFEGLGGLKKLLLRDQPLTTIDFLHNITNLELLDLGGSNVEERFLNFPNEMTGIKRLVLGGSFVNFSTDIIANMKGLEELLIEGNTNLTYFHHSPGTQFPLLHTIWIRGSNLSQIPEGIKSAPNLKELNLEFGSITTEGLEASKSVFQSVPNLEKLHLVGNQLSGYMPSEIFSSLTNLTVLTLRANQITDFSETGWPESLSSVDVAVNNLTTMPKFWVNLPNISTLHTDANPFICNCSLLWLKEFVATSEFLEYWNVCEEVMPGYPSKKEEVNGLIIPEKLKDFVDWIDESKC